MTISPDGELVPVEQRLAEIQNRYGPRHLVSRSIQRAAPMILGVVKQVHNKAAEWPPTLVRSVRISCASAGSTPAA
jgi:hypothetical protein